MTKNFSNATERSDDRGSYRHSPYVLVTANTTQAGLAVSNYTKINFGNVLVNDNGAWNVDSGKYICLRSGRLQFGAGLLLQNGTAGRNDYQLVVRVDDANDNLITRVQLLYDWVDSSQLVGFSGNLLYPVEFGWKLYPELFVGVNGAGSSIFPNGSVIYNQFHCYYVD